MVAMPSMRKTARARRRNQQAAEKLSFPCVSVAAGKIQTGQETQ
jgi:hypothetical protein